MPVITPGGSRKKFRSDSEGSLGEESLTNSSSQAVVGERKSAMMALDDTVDDLGEVILF